MVLFGSTTGRDGIGGASVLASARRSPTTIPSKRPSVQVGDPFAEKLLIEASLELIERGLVEGLQDLGAGGITCATSETADRAGTGMLVDLDAIPRREPGMEPFEVMISESQERMLRGRPPGSLGRRSARSASAGACRCAVIGRVTATPDIAIVDGGRSRRLERTAGRYRRGQGAGPDPGRALTSDAIVHERIAAPRPSAGAPPRHPAHRIGAGGPAAGAGHGPGRRAARAARARRTSRRAARSSSSTTAPSQANTVAGPGRGAAVLRVKGTTKALVATTDGERSRSARSIRGSVPP